MLFLNSTDQPLPYEHPRCNDYCIEICYGHPRHDAHTFLQIRCIVFLLAVRKLHAEFVHVLCCYLKYRTLNPDVSLITHVIFESYQNC